MSSERGRIGPWVSPDYVDPPDLLRPDPQWGYVMSERRAQRVAFFHLAEQACPRCGCPFGGRDTLFPQLPTSAEVVTVAPPGVPRMTVHLQCVEVGDVIYAPPPQG